MDSTALATNKLVGVTVDMYLKFYPQVSGMFQEGNYHTFEFWDMLELDQPSTAILLVRSPAVL